jgi:tetratricopeptide (TPR) repeat protein
MLIHAKGNFSPTSPFTRVVILLAIIGLTLFVYWDIKNHQFLNFDDNMYVTTNLYVKNGFSLENVRWAFTFTDVSYWQPLPLLSHMLDSQLFGLKPGPHLLVNLAMHILNSLLLFLIMARLTGAPIKAALVALLFAVHPLNVESVAWLAERKTVLSTLFFFAALYGYVHYTQRKRKWIYAAILCLYTLGLMTKPPILTFPVLLLLLDYWPLKRFGRPDADQSDCGATSATKSNRCISFWRSDTGMIILEKVPFFVLSALSLFITMASVMHQQMVVNQQLVPIYLRVYNLFVSIIQYLRYMAWPVELSIFYPFPRTIVLADLALSLSAVGLITLVAYMKRRKRPWLITGWCWYLIALSPASGLIQAGLWPGIANRFMYIPMIGLFIMVIWECDERLRGRYSRFLKAVLCIVMLVYFAALTRVQNNYFSNSFALFSRCLEVVGENELGLNNLGVALSSLGRQDEALACFDRSIKRNPTQASAHHNYGVCLVAKGDEAGAIPYFEKAISLNPKMTNPLVHLGLIQSNRGNVDGAMEHLEKALKIDPNNLDVRNNYGTILSTQRKFDEAIPHFLFVLKKDPAHLQARINLSQAYEEAGRYSEAMTEYRTLDKTITHNKGYIYYRMARVHSQQKKFAECENYLEMALKDGFDLLKLITSDNGFILFRETPAYHRFLEMEAPRPQAGASR